MKLELDKGACRDCGSWVDCLLFVDDDGEVEDQVCMGCFFLRGLRRMSEGAGRHPASPGPAHDQDDTETGEAGGGSRCPKAN